MVKTYTFTSKNSSDFKERLSQIETFLNRDQIRALESMKDIMIVEETDENGNVVSLNVIDIHHNSTNNKKGKIQTNYEVLKNDNSILLRNTYHYSLLQKIKSIRDSKDPPFLKLTNLIYTSRDYETRKFSMIMTKLGRKFKISDDEYVSYLPNLVALLLDLAIFDAKNGETKTMQQWYDTIVTLLEKLESKGDEYQQLQTENQSLRNRVRDLEEQLSAAKKRNNLKQEEIVRLRNQVFVLQNQQLSPGVIFDMLPNDEAYKKKEKALEDKIKNLQDELGNESVPLSVLAEGLKDYVAEAGISKAQELFERLCYILLNVPAWTKNVPGLKTFFKKARKELEGRNVTMTGEHATYNENNKE